MAFPNVEGFCSQFERRISWCGTAVVLARLRSVHHHASGGPLRNTFVHFYIKDSRKKKINKIGKEI